MPSAQFSNVCCCKRLNDNLLLLLNHEFLRHVHHLFHGGGARDLQNPLWTSPYIYLALYILSYNCPDDKGSTSRNSHLSNAVHESAVSLVLHRNHEFYELFTRELMKKKSKTEAYIVVGERLLFHIYSMMKNSRPYRERKPGNSDKGRGSLPVQ